MCCRSEARCAAEPQRGPVPDWSSPRRECPSNQTCRARVSGDLGCEHGGFGVTGCSSVVEARTLIGSSFRHRRIVEFEQAGKMRAAYGAKLIERLRRSDTAIQPRIRDRKPRADAEILPDMAKARDFSDSV